MANHQANIRQKFPIVTTLLDKRNSEVNSSGNRDNILNKNMRFMSLHKGNHSGINSSYSQQHKDMTSVVGLMMQQQQKIYLMNQQQLHLATQNGTSNKTGQSIIGGNNLTNTPNQLKKQNRGVMFIYNFWIGMGNNGQVVKRVLQTRQNWIEVGEGDRCHFKWAQSPRGFKYDLMNTSFAKQMVNHFEGHGQLSDKAKLIRNLNEYCQSNRINMFNFTPPTFIIDFSDVFCDKFLNDFLVYYAKYYPKNVSTTQINKMRMDYLQYFKYLISGSGDKHKPITNKYCIYHMLQTFLDKTQNNYLWLLKPTFLNRGRGVRVFSQLQTLKDMFKQYTQGFLEKLPSSGGIGNNSNNPNINQQQKKQSTQVLSQSFIKTDAFVIQKYIQRPLLIHKRKFDIRTWTLIDQDYNVYFFKQGYVRMSSEQYDLSENNIQNVFVHLTNNAIQKHNENYCKFESGNQLSFAYLQKYIRENYPEAIQGLPIVETSNINKADIFFERFITGKMKQIVALSTLSAKKKLNSMDRKYCMQIFGYDFIIDQKLNMWLIEVNTNPCLEESSTILKELIPRMLNDAFKITIDVFFPKWNSTNVSNSSVGDNGGRLANNSSVNTSSINGNALNNINNPKLKIIETRVPQRMIKNEKFRVSGYQDDKNMWEFLCNISPGPLISRRKRQKRGVFIG